MSQPSVKFISHFASYVVFICMIITSNLNFASEEHHLVRFSEKFEHYFENFTNYIENDDLIYRPKFSDFYLRPSFPNELDIVISVWILGRKFFINS